MKADLDGDIVVEGETSAVSITGTALEVVAGLPVALAVLEGVLVGPEEEGETGEEKEKKEK